MKLGIRLALTALLATSLVSPLSAQQQDGQNRQRGQGGPGGRFGGGFGGGMFGGGGLLALAQIPEVQKEIKVTDDQKGLIEEMAKDLREGGQRFNGEEFRSLSEEQRRARGEELRKQFEERIKQADEGVKVALEEKQVARLKELQIQREIQTTGVYASLNRAEVADQLKLSQDQKDKVAKIRDDNRPQFGRGGPGGGQRPQGQDGQRPDPQAAFAEFRARREKANTEALAILNADQKTAFEKMQGTKFEFPAPQFGRGPGGGQGGQRPGGRPQPE
jgi:hypothetical protein